MGNSPLALAHGSPQYLVASATTGSNFYFVGAASYATSALSNSGIQGTIQVVSTQVTGCLSFWVADESTAKIWGQIGYYICNGSTPVAFYQINDLNTGSVLVAGKTSVSTGYHQFSMYAQSGTTWAYALDGGVFGTYNMGASTSSSTYPIEAMSEEGYVSGPWNPPQVQLTQIQVMNAGAWSSVQTGYQPYGCSQTNSYSCWGAQGNVQNSSIPGGELAVGGNTSPILSGTSLWTSLTSSSTTSLSSTTSTTSSSSMVTTASSTATSTASSTVSVDNTPPTVVIQSPAQGATVSGKVTVSVSASDDTGIKMVQFYIDGKLVATDSSTPYQYVWNTRSVKSGSHTIVVVAYDYAGNQAQASVTVTK